MGGSRKWSQAKIFVSHAHFLIKIKKHAQCQQVVILSGTDFVMPYTGIHLPQPESQNGWGSTYNKYRLYNLSILFLVYLASDAHEVVYPSNASLRR